MQVHEVAEEEALSSFFYRPDDINRSTMGQSTTRSVVEQEPLEEKIENVYQDLGGVGKFQVFAMVTLLLGLSGQNWWFYEIGYLS